MGTRIGIIGAGAIGSAEWAASLGLQYLKKPDPRNLDPLVGKLGR